MIKAIFFDWGNISVKGFKDKDKELNGILKPLGFIWKKFNPNLEQFLYLNSCWQDKNRRRVRNL